MKILHNLLSAVLFTLLACIDKVDLALPSSELPLIVEGFVTDDPGPYVVKISKAFPADGRYHPRLGVAGARVVITDDAGFRDVLSEFPGGSYVTDSLRGVIGRSYRLTITTANNLKLESTWEKMMPAGTIDRIYFEFVKGQTKDDNLPIEGFNVYADATTAPGSERRIRWSWKGTYIIITDPAALTIGNPPTPLACAENCICCTCWVSEREVSPILANQGFLGSNKLNRNFMTFLIANNIRFFEKYRIEIEQMEVSQPVFDFLQGVRGQVDNASSLFQPPFFELKGNIKSAASPAAVIGIFSANAVTRKSIYIYQSDIPYVIYADRPIGDCRAVAPNSVNVQPPFWE